MKFTAGIQSERALQNVHSYSGTQNYIKITVRCEKILLSSQVKLAPEAVPAFL